MIESGSLNRLSSHCDRVIFYELCRTFGYCFLNLRFSTLFQPGVEFRITEFSVPLVC